MPLHHHHHHNHRHNLSLKKIRKIFDRFSSHGHKLSLVEARLALLEIGHQVHHLQYIHHNSHLPHHPHHHEHGYVDFPGFLQFVAPSAGHNHSHNGHHHSSHQPQEVVHHHYHHHLSRSRTLRAQALQAQARAAHPALRKMRNITRSIIKNMPSAQLHLQARRAAQAQARLQALALRQAQAQAPAHRHHLLKMRNITRNTTRSMPRDLLALHRAVARAHLPRAHHQARAALAQALHLLHLKKRSITRSTTRSMERNMPRNITRRLHRVARARRVPQAHPAHISSVMAMSMVRLYQTRHSMVATIKYKMTRKLTLFIYYSYMYIFGIFIMMIYFFDETPTNIAKLYFLQVYPCPPQEYFDDRTLILTTDISLAIFCMTLAVFNTVPQGLYFAFVGAYHLLKVKSISLSATTKKMQLTFLYNASIQMAIPFVAILIPVSIFGLMLLLSTYSQLINNIIILTLSIHGLLSNISLICLHKPYRDHTIDLVFGENSRIKSISSVRTIVISDNQSPRN
ncbi:unnamed protein product [Caenorhabditis angaria]|uniref:Uncharacterized protein n=1 Tax=Caenorhabditis angaria TaxID=860376 RepID=A0A9P1N6T1_9PELO|nr:unnamed protein product [Caenorhabditis angaria]